MKFFITGANGFIGSYLTRYLLQCKHEVTAHSRNFLADIRKELNGAIFIEGDILSEDFAKIKCDADVVVHLAASNDILSKNVSKGIELSAVGTVNALKFAANNNIPKFIFFSTLQVYGTELSGIYDETSPVKPENDYAMNHLFGEMYTEMYSRKSGLKTLVARPSNIYGRFLSTQVNRWTLVPGCFIKEAAEKNSITLLSSGKQNRNFISLEQLGYYTEMVSKTMSKAFDIVNFVSDNYHTISDTAILTKEIFKSDLGKEVELHIKSEQPVQSKTFSFSHSKLEEYGISLTQTKEVTLTTEIRNILQLLLQDKSAIQS